MNSSFWRKSYSSTHSCDWRGKTWSGPSSKTCDSWLCLVYTASSGHAIVTDQTALAGMAWLVYSHSGWMDMMIWMVGISTRGSRWCSPSCVVRSWRAGSIGRCGYGWLCPSLGLLRRFPLSTFQTVSPPLSVGCRGRSGRCQLHSETQPGRCSSARVSPGHQWCLFRGRAGWESLTVRQCPAWWVWPFPRGGDGWDWAWREGRVRPPTIKPRWLIYLSYYYYMSLPPKRTNTNEWRC